MAVLRGNGGRYGAAVAPADNGAASTAKGWTSKSPFVEDVLHELWHHALLVPILLVAVPILFASIHLCDNVLVVNFKHDVVMSLVCAGGVWWTVSNSLLHVHASGALSGRRIAWASLAGVAPFAACLLGSAVSQRRVGLWVFAACSLSAVLYWGVLLQGAVTTAGPRRVGRQVLVLSAHFTATVAFGSAYTGLPNIVTDAALQVLLFGIVGPLLAILYVSATRLIAPTTGELCGYSGDNLDRFADQLCIIVKLSMTIQTFVVLFLVPDSGAFFASVALSLVNEVVPLAFLLLLHWRRARNGADDEASKDAVAASAKALCITLVDEGYAESVSLVLGGVVTFLVSKPYSAEELVVRITGCVCIELASNVAKKLLARRAGVNASLYKVSTSLGQVLAIGAFAQSLYYIAWTSMWLYTMN